MSEPEPRQPLNFNNTEIAFSTKTDSELIKTFRLFKLMKNQTLVDIGSSLGLLAVKLNLPFTKTIIRRTIFNQFCGGENLMDCQTAIDNLYQFDTLTVLDYGAEAKSSEEELNAVMEETIRAVELAASNNSVPVVSTKLSGLADNEILEKVQTGAKLDSGEQRAYDQLYERINSICERACELGVGVFVDAEESWVQDTIDDLVDRMMIKYNKEKCIVYNTYQLYRHDKLGQLKKDHETAKQKGYFLGAKLVRGAYMEKERERADVQGYPSPIQPDKDATDHDFDEGIRYCMEHYLEIASCCASHNMKSNMLQAEIIKEQNLPKDHPHLNFSQLYGMSDFITFNLASAGYNVAKYVPYGPIKEVVPYLIRRAQENSSVTGEMGRELAMIAKEKERRGI